MATVRYEFDVDWTDEELADYQRTVGQPTETVSNWYYAVPFGIGLATSVVAIMVGAVEPDDARFVGLLGTMAAFGGWYTAAWAGRRLVTRARKRDLWRRYRIVVDRAGVRFSNADADCLLRWPGVIAIETSPRMIQLCTKQSGNLTIPSRYLASREERVAFAAFVRQQIADSHVAAPDRDETARPPS